MAEKVISALVEGGKATAGPPIGPALGPLGINAGQVVAEINQKTKDFSGITVPVKIIVDTSTKKYTIEIGTPPTSALIKKELLLEKGSGKPKEEIVGDLAIDQAIKIAKMKQSQLLSKDLKKALKEVVGTCVSLGVLVEGKNPKEVLAEIDSGKYDDLISGKKPLREIPKEEIERKKKEFASKIAASKPKEEGTAEEKPEEKK